MLCTFVLSQGYDDAYVTQAQKVRSILLEKIKSVFKEVDAIIFPVSQSTAFKIGEKNSDTIEMFLADIYKVFANLQVIHGISIHLFTHTNCLPFGIMQMMSIFN